MTNTGKLIVLGAVVGAGLIAGQLIGRVRRSKCYADAGGGHTAVLDAAGKFVQCEDDQGRVVAPALCTGYTPCRPSSSTDQPTGVLWSPAWWQAFKSNPLFAVESPPIFSWPWSDVDELEGA